MTEDILEEEGLGLKQKQKSIVDHLQAPRRKKRNYVVIALGSQIDYGLKQRIEYYIKLNHPHLTVVFIKDLKEFAKMYSRQISLLLVSDDFADLDQKIEIIRRFKEKNSGSGMPTLFFTESARKLSEAYHEKLVAYQEVDDFVEWTSKSEKHVLSLVADMVSGVKRRRARRFPIPFRVQYFDLRTGKHFDGVLMDVSMQGALLQKQHVAPLFHNGDQIKVILKLEHQIDKAQGETLHLSAKVRRTVIGGERAGISWEHLSEEKTNVLLRFITEASNSYLEKKTWLEKAELAFKRKTR